MSRTLEILDAGELQKEIASYQSGLDVFTKVLNLLG